MAETQPKLQPALLTLLNIPVVVFPCVIGAFSPLLIDVFPHEEICQGYNQISHFRGLDN